MPVNRLIIVLALVFGVNVAEADEVWFLSAGKEGKKGESGQNGEDGESSFLGNGGNGGDGGDG